MHVVNDAPGDVVSTDDNPIVRPGLDVDLSCRHCGHVFELADARRDIPGGHGKWVRIVCPECDKFVAREKGTNRYVDEDFVGMSIADAFDAKFDEDVTLLSGGEVEPDQIGSEITEVVIFHPDSGTFERHEIDDVYTDAQRLRNEAGMAYAAPSLLTDDIPAGVVFGESSFKPIGYDAEWDNDDEDFDPGEANKTVIRFVASP